MAHPLRRAPPQVPAVARSSDGRQEAATSITTVHLRGEPASPLFVRLANALKKHALPRFALDPALARTITGVLANPGGLFRAELAFLSAQVCGLPDDDAEALACTLEYFHGASLLFDDLPFMDNSSVRRGEICAHLLHGEGAAVLAALALITRGYALAGATISHAPAERQGAAHALLERCLGAAGMLNGQARDLHFHTAQGTARDTMQIALAKTAPLIHLALALPAVLAGRGAGELRARRRLSVCWGLYYQGVDDLGDLLHTTEASGKSAGQDERLGRPNVARTLGPEHAARYLRRLEAVAQRSIDTLATADAGQAFLQTYHRLLTGRLEGLAARPA